jgi:hypothetical protein
VTAGSASLRTRFEGWLAGPADESVLRWLLRATLAATVVVVGIDFADLNARATDRPRLTPGLQERRAEPLPTSRPDEAPPGQRRDDRLRRSMTFDLTANGRLVATGTIEPGSAETFAAEVEKRGSYIKTVVLHSPGGSVADALAMGRLIRAKNFATEVEKDSYCASSCPLMFAGGGTRRADAKAAIGVHQVSAVPITGAPALTGSSAMTSAQQISAECQRYLREMGVDLQVWVHAMETPKDALYYFKPAELTALKLATEISGAPKASARAGAVNAPTGNARR